MARAILELERRFRVMLELSYRRGLDDATIADVAGFDEGRIKALREQALAWLSQRTGGDGAEGIAAVESDLRALSPAQWAGELDAEEGAESEVSADETDRSPATSATAATERDGRAERSGWRVPILTLAALLTVGAVVIVLASGSDESTDEAGPAASAPVATAGGSDGTKDAASGGGESASGSTVNLQAVPGAEVSGSVEATLSGSDSRPMLTMRLSGFPKPDGEYVAWLYKSVIDSVPLGGTSSGTGRIERALPDDWRDYPFVDVSVEDEGTEVHSGRSVARIALDDLLSR